MEEKDHKELQLLPTRQSRPSSSRMIPLWPSDSSSMKKHRSSQSSSISDSPFDHHHGPSLDLQLSISLRPIMRPPVPDYHDQYVGGGGGGNKNDGDVESLKWQAAEQIRLAAMEKAYAERVRELTRREMELAQSEFARARNTWERAREEVEKAEKMKEMATYRIDSTCMEITCQSCRQRFRP